MSTLHNLIGEYYGLDWGTLVLGVSANLMLTNGHLRLGFFVNIVACVCAFAVATMSHQNGFLVYNILLIAINLRGVLRGDRRAVAREAQAAAETA
jgi:hypothetical protein